MKVLFENILIVLSVAVILGVIYKTITGRVTILEYQRGLRYVNGRFSGIVGPGAYTIIRRTTTIKPVDVRPTALCVAGQEVLSSDGLAVRVSLVVNYRISDPDTAVNKAENYYNSFYLALQVALREVIAGSNLESLLAQRNEMSEKLNEIVRTSAETLGLEMISINIRDLTLPGELKKVFTQVVKARQEGLAALERARGETAALRSLANAAKMIEKSPGMLPLRMLHAIGQSTGNTYVMGLPSAAMPIPVQGKALGEIESGESEE